MSGGRKSGVPAPAGRRGARRGGRGVLLVIATFLAASGLIHLGGSAGSALANVDAAAAPAAEPAACEPEGGALAMLEALKAREARLVEREAALADRTQALSLAETKIEERIAVLIAAEEELAATMAMAEEASEADVAKLTAVYESMKPKEAAPLFEEMAPDFAAGFLARMRPDAAAAIMAGLEPRTAYTISAVLAGRNAAAPKD
ncbi:MotE family protein [Ostreiculturibacter nitratireducens]|uniref:MotE family protein n=1 Tax=Ostreiculturibacter nitratireducens TaxID=3075226 RepID=UPI0031B59531